MSHNENEDTIVFGNESALMGQSILNDNINDMFRENKSLNIGDLIQLYEDKLYEKDSQLEGFNRRLLQQQ